MVSLTLGPISGGRSRKPGREFPFPFLPLSSDLTTENETTAWQDGVSGGLNALEMTYGWGTCEFASGLDILGVILSGVICVVVVFIVHSDHG